MQDDDGVGLSNFTKKKGPFFTARKVCRKGKQRHAREAYKKYRARTHSANFYLSLSVSLILERSRVGALKGDAGVVDEDVAPPVFLLDLRRESL